MTDEEIFSLKAIKLNVFVERQIYQVLFLKKALLACLLLLYPSNLSSADLVWL